MSSSPLHSHYEALPAMELDAVRPNQLLLLKTVVAACQKEAIPLHNSMENVVQCLMRVITAPGTSRCVVYAHARRPRQQADSIDDRDWRA